MLVRFSRQSSVPGRCHHPDAALTFCHAATGTEGQKVRVSIVAPLVHIRLPRAAADHVRHVRDRRASICISLLIRWSDGAHVAVTAAFLVGQSEEHGHKSRSSHPGAKSSQVKSSQVKSSQVKSSQGSRIMLVLTLAPTREGRCCIGTRHDCSTDLWRFGARATMAHGSTHTFGPAHTYVTSYAPGLSVRHHAAAISDSISSARLGALAVRTSGGAPSARTKTSSSMRMPIPLHQSGSSGSLVGK